jgi:hypothetical protein
MVHRDSASKSCSASSQGKTRAIILNSLSEGNAELRMIAMTYDAVVTWKERVVMLRKRVKTKLSVSNGQ